jgi:hypothetical protein
MADLNKFEEMLERLINEDKAGAEELFHEIVVEKSRDIYESLLEDEEVDEADDEDLDESDDEDLDEADDEDLDESDDEDLDEGFDLDEFEVEADPMVAFGGDMADDLEGDVDDMAGDMDGDMDGEEGDVEDRVEDLEDALDELKAEFEKMMAGDDEGDDEEGDMDMDMGDEEGDEEEAEEESFQFEAEDEDDDEEVDESKKSETETMREYVEKVSATMGDNGANTKSSVAGANNMGGTAGNLNQAGSDTSAEAGAGSTIKGNALSDTSAKDMSTGNVNVPGGKASKSMKAQPKGHGAEKKGSGETGTNGTKSVIGQ